MAPEGPVEPDGQGCRADGGGRAQSENDHRGAERSGVGDGGEVRTLDEQQGEDPGGQQDADQCGVVGEVEPDGHRQQHDRHRPRTALASQDAAGQHHEAHPGQGDQGARRL